MSKYSIVLLAAYTLTTSSSIAAPPPPPTEAVAPAAAPPAAAPSPAVVAPAVPAPAPPAVQDGDLRAAEAQKAREEQATRSFAGINFGVALSLTMDTGDHSRIGSATVDENGIVRVDDANDLIARVMLETHYFFNVDTFISFGLGPFIAIQPGTDDIIDAIGGGVLLGFRTDRSSTSSFNIGIGYVYDPNVRVLGDGIKENEPLPKGETTVRYKEVAQKGLLLIASFSWF